MKTLYLLRHAKSDWGEKGVDDHDRPLNERGRAAALLIGKAMREAGHHPARVFCSTARRTRETVDALLKFLPAQTPVQHTRALYLASPERMLALLYEDAQDAASAMLVGHNPGMEHLALLLAREDGAATERARRAQLAEKFPTAALAVLRFAIDDWSDVRPGTGALDAFVRPRDIAE